MILYSTVQLFRCLHYVFGYPLKSCSIPSNKPILKLMQRQTLSCRRSPSLILGDSSSIGLLVDSEPATICQRQDLIIAEMVEKLRTTGLVAISLFRRSLLD